MRISSSLYVLQQHFSLKIKVKYRKEYTKFIDNLSCVSVTYCIIKMIFLKWVFRNKFHVLFSRGHYN